MAQIEKINPSYVTFTFDMPGGKSFEARSRRYTQELSVELARLDRQHADQETASLKQRSDTVRRYALLSQQAGQYAPIASDTAREKYARLAEEAADLMVEMMAESLEGEQEINGFREEQRVREWRQFVEVLQAVIDHDALKSDAQRQAIESNPESEFWMYQNVLDLEAAVRRFRDLRKA